jgi:hypothetical protein
MLSQLFIRDNPLKGTIPFDIGKAMPKLNEMSFGTTKLQGRVSLPPHRYIQFQMCDELPRELCDEARLQKLWPDLTNIGYHGPSSKDAGHDEENTQEEEDVHKHDHEEDHKGRDQRVQDESSASMHSHFRSHEVGEDHEGRGRHRSQDEDNVGSGAWKHSHFRKGETPRPHENEEDHLKVMRSIFKNLEQDIGNLRLRNQHLR